MPGNIPLRHDSHISYIKNIFEDQIRLRAKRLSGPAPTESSRSIIFKERYILIGMFKLLLHAFFLLQNRKLMVFGLQNVNTR